MTQTIRSRVLSLDWNGIGAGLSDEGYALLPSLLTPTECNELSGMYPNDAAFRSHVVMSRFGFGRGEYKYFQYPLPGLVAELRESLYPHLARFANSWAKETGGDAYPLKHSDYLE